jgi:hypothetical protein
LNNKGKVKLSVNNVNNSNNNSGNKLGSMNSGNANKNQRSCCWIIIVIIIRSIMLCTQHNIIFYFDYLFKIYV